jgi:hypothetical protein
MRGSGLFVGETGVEANHRFLIPKDGSTFQGTEGRYRMDVFAKLWGDRKQTLRFSRLLKSHARPLPFFAVFCAEDQINPIAGI